MTKPIEATPRLKGKEAVDFIVTIHRESSNHVGIVATPKLSRLKELIKKYKDEKLVH